MTTITDLIEDWIQIRTTLQKQIATLESAKAHMEANVPESTTSETITRLKGWVGELNKLLKVYSNADRPRT